MKPLKFDVFGRLVLIVQTERGWTVFYVGAEGKRRQAEDIVIPPFVTAAEIERYLADLCHEWASEKHPEVKRVE